MPSARITDAYVKALKPPADGKEKLIFDTELAGFFVRLRPSGAVSFGIQYRTGAGGRQAAQRRMTLKATGTVAEVRAIAKKTLARAMLGEDPSAARSQARATPKLADLVARYLVEEVAPTKAPGTLGLYEIYARLHINPVLGMKQANGIAAKDVMALRNKLTTVDADGNVKGRVTANRVITFLSGVFTWASRHEPTMANRPNPCANATKFRETVKERFLDDDELRRLGEALVLAETTGIPWSEGPKSKHSQKTARFTNFGPHVTAAIRLLLLTGARLREVLHLRWDMVDMQRGMLFLPSSKTGKKSIVLSEPAMDVLRTLQGIRIGAYVIAGLDPDRPRADLQRPWAAICQHAGLRDVRLHDLRHSFASVGAGGGLGLPIIGKLLGHSQSDTTARYAHLATSPLKRAADQIAGELAAALAGRKPG